MLDWPEGQPWEEPPTSSDQESSPKPPKEPASALPPDEIEAVLQALRRLGYEVLPRMEASGKAKKGEEKAEHWPEMPPLSVQSKEKSRRWEEAAPSSSSSAMEEAPPMETPESQGSPSTSW